MAKANIPERPFLADDFSPKGGGLDFLGLRWVNLTILGEYLLPGVNNATRDVGTYCIGAWIPWKFRQLCKGPKDFSRLNFTAFKEAIEVAMSVAIRNESPSCQQYGTIRQRLGVDQQISLPCILTYQNAERTNATSIYAAPLYGPSLRYLGLIDGEAVAQDGSSSKILLTSDDLDTTSIVEAVDDLLQKSPYYSMINRIQIPKMGYTEIDDLGSCGLNPASIPRQLQAIKRVFAHKLLPTEDSGHENPRTQTARLIAQTLQQQPGLNADQLRGTWYTNLLPDGKRLNPLTKAINEHRKRWAIFMSRQHQRYALELFLQAFEANLKSGGRSIEQVVANQIDFWKKTAGSVPRNFESLLADECAWTGEGRDFPAASNAWNKEVHCEHEAFEYFDCSDMDEACHLACRILARWWIRMIEWREKVGHKDLLALGDADRISIDWFWYWLDCRRKMPFAGFLKEFFSDLIFAQHMRVALARFDGQTQRLRFVLGDKGIIPAAKLSGNNLPWMADRLVAFIDLLCDISILNQDAEGSLTLGDNADYVI